MDTRPLMAYLYAAPLVFGQDSSELTPVPELEYQSEQQKVMEALREMHVGIRWRTYVANIHNFSLAISESQILHFTGHGEDGNVMIEDDQGKGSLKSQQQIRFLFEERPTKPQLVFVSACHSESVAEAFVNSGIPHVIAVSKNDKVLDQASLVFAHQFYTHIVQGQSVEHAFNAARACVIVEVEQREG